MQELDSNRPLGRLILDFVLCYAALFLMGAVGLWLILVVRDILIASAMRIHVNPWQIRAIDMWGTFLLGLSWLIAFVLIESYFRNGVRLHLLWKRIARVYMIAGLVTLSSLLVNWLL